MSRSEIEAFSVEVNQPDDQINLARAVLVMGRFEYPALNVSDYLDHIDRLADAAERELARAELPALVLARFLFERLGFTGNVEHYADPRNSFLNEVLERRLGIPISLSVLYLEVARRMGVSAMGVGLPGHFIVRAALDNGQEIYIDPFHRGALLTEEDCRERVRTVTGGWLPFHEAFLNPVGVRYILVRMLNNLRNFYAASSDYARAAEVIERLLVLHPNDIDETRNLGLIYGALGRRRQAATLLERYLAQRPDANDAEAVRKFLASMSEQSARWN